MSTEREKWEKAADEIIDHALGAGCIVVAIENAVTEAKETFLSELGIANDEAVIVKLLDQQVKQIETQQAEIDRLKVELGAATKLLKHLWKEVLANDYNEHWESYKALDAWITKQKEQR